jgi:hypothetical protein
MLPRPNPNRAAIRAIKKTVATARLIRPIGGNHQVR